MDVTASSIMDECNKSDGKKGGGGEGMGEGKDSRIWNPTL